MHGRRCLITALAFGAFLIGSTLAEARDRPARQPPRHDNHVGGYATWCALHFAARDYRLAIEDCDEALIENPADAESYSNRGAAYLMINEPDRAILDFESAMRLKEGDVVLHYNLATAYTKKGDHAKAITSYTESIRLNPALAPAYNNRGHAYEVLGHRELAIADYRRALELAPALASVVRQNLRRLGAE